MSTRGALGWVIVATGLVTGYWFTGNLAVEQQRVVYDAKKFFEFDSGDIHRMSISTREAELIEAERVGEDTWKILSPYSHIPANDALWTRMAEALPEMINERPIEVSPEDLALYGLDDPPLRLVVEAAGAITQLNVGNLDPTQNNRYAQLGDGEIFLLPANMANAFYQPLQNLRDTRLFPGITETADRVHFQRFAVGEVSSVVDGTEAIDEVYVLDDDGTWVMIEPEPAVIFQNEMLHLIKDLSSLTGAGYIDDPAALGDFGLDPPWAKIQVSGSDSGTERTMILGWLDDMAEDGRMFASMVGDQSVFTIDASFIERLPDAPGDFREKRLFTGQATQLSAIHYRDRSRSFTLSNSEESGWALTDPAHDDTESLLVSEFISFMKQFAGNSFPDEAELANLGEERIRFDFEYSDGIPDSYFAIYGPVPDSDPMEFYARQDVGTVITVPLEAVQLFVSTPFRFRNRAVFSFDPASALRVSVTLDGLRRTVVQRESSGEKVFAVTEPPDHGLASEADLVQILSTLPSLTALGVHEAETDVEVLGFDNPTLVAEVDWIDESGSRESKRLEIGNLIAAQSRYHFARVLGRPEVFYVDHAYIEDLREGLNGVVPVSGQ